MSKADAAVRQQLSPDHPHQQTLQQQQQQQQQVVVVGHLVVNHSSTVPLGLVGGEQPAWIAAPTARQCVAVLLLLLLEGRVSTRTFQAQAPPGCSCRWMFAGICATCRGLPIVRAQQHNLAAGNT